MRTAYFDCFSGISGDMTIAAFLDAGLDLKVLDRELKKLRLTGYELKARKVKRGEISGTKFDCIVKAKSQPHRPLNKILELIDGSALKERVKDIAKNIFLTLGHAEARIHGLTSKEEVEFHEVGDLDSIIDMVGTAVAIDELGIDEIRASNLNYGRTFARCRHGTIPIPGPAALEILKDVPSRIIDVEAELVTPTGAAIIKTLSRSFGGMPLMRISDIGYGAGTKVIKEIPNLLRIIIGEAIIAIIFLLSAMSHELPAAYADTILMRDGKEIKGIVVEDYRDRLTFSTADGEISIMKSNIRELSYDSEEDNLINLGEQARDRKDYPRAYAYYEMALKKNPESKTAKNGMVFIQGYLYRKDEVRKEEAVKRQEELERYGPTVPSRMSEEDAFKENTAKLKESLGLTLVMLDSSPTVENAMPGLPADDAGMRSGDLLVAVWSRLTGYMPLRDVVKMLLEKPVLEIKCTIERTLAISPSWGNIGASFNMEFDGLTVSNIKANGPAARAGLAKDDLVVAINGQSTRYMPLKKALELIKRSRGNVNLTFRREITIWRRGKV